MEVAIIPSVRISRPVPRFAFYDSTPEVFGLDDELHTLMVRYADYLHVLTGERRTLGELAQGLTMQALGEEDTWNFWGWLHRTERDEPSYRHLLSTWPLTFDGFDCDVVWVIKQWSDFSADVEGCPISPNDIVRGMTWMMIDDDEDFRVWSLRPSLWLAPTRDR